ncbi:hypothetical protein JB92DRAFT_2950911 [Gautieria morchelliformis]|nr:hypothetical protein JB92DRAFT_2950911 [Gautieria morchelliformis]
MARQKGKVTTKPPGEPPPSKPKTREWDVVDPSHIVEGRRSRTPSSRLLQSSDAKPVSKLATGSETARIPSKPPPVHPSTAPKAMTAAPKAVTAAPKAVTAAPAPAPPQPLPLHPPLLRPPPLPLPPRPAPAPGPVTTAALSTILEEQESQIETDADDEDLYVDHPSVSSDEDLFSGLEPLDVELPAPSDQSSKARVARKVGKGASKAAVALPHTIKFSIPSRFGLKQLIWRTHHVELTTTIADLKETIHLILGLDAIPAVKRPPLVTHIKHDPAKLCFALKDEWRKRAAKRGEDTCIEIVTGPKFFDFLEEAVAAHAASSKGKAKGKAKPAVNPFLPDDAAIESELVAKLGAADMAREAWFCDRHPKSICMARALRGHHKVLNFEGELSWVLELIGGTSGVDINTPPKIEYFKFFHTQDGSSAPVLRRVDDSPTPTIGEWITHLEMQRLTYKRWDFLQQKFAEEESMDMLISSLARLSLANLKVGYSLKMVDAVFILEQLEVAGKRYGFAVGAQDDDRQRSKKARY